MDCIEGFAQYLLEDLDKYYFHFHDTDHDITELISPMRTGKYQYTVSVPRLIEATKDKKLIEIGSMFGSGRIRAEREEYAKRGGFFQRSLSFNNPVLNTPSNIIKDLMGGSDNYIGIHARVGDGWFLSASMDNMRHTLTEILNKLEIPQRVHARLMKAGEDRIASLAAEAKSGKQKRSSGLRRHLQFARRSGGQESTEELLSMWTAAEASFEDDSAPVERLV